jgi:uncharacterized membrane protein
VSSKRKRKAAARAAKRERFATQAQESPKGASPLVLIGGLAVVIVVIATGFVRLNRPAAVAPAEVAVLASASAPPVRAATSGHAPYAQVLAENGEVRLAAATFDDYQAHHYTYMHAEDPIEFFVLKSEDGVIRAAFNACDVCFLSQKGYTQDGDEMICNNCGRRFPADQINVLQGGCNPSPLDRTLVGDTLVIRVEDIISGARYF